MQITILNWEEYNPRREKNLKSMHWFRLETELPFNPKMFDLTINAKWVFICLLCICAKKMSDTIDISEQYLCHISGVNKDITKIIDSLSKAGLIRYKLGTDLTEIVPLHNITEQTNKYMSTCISLEQTSCPKPTPITFNDKLLKFENITEEHGELWHSAYPAVNLEAELNSMVAWLKANPKNKKSNYERFITSWLKRTQDKARRV